MTTVLIVEDEAAHGDAIADRLDIGERGVALPLHSRQQDLSDGGEGAGIVDRDEIDAVAPHAERLPTATALELDEPDRPPARLHRDLDHAPAEPLLQPTNHRVAARIHTGTLEPAASRHHCRGQTH